MTSHPKALSAPGYRPLILACLSDEDSTIRTRALDLLIGIATLLEKERNGFSNLVIASR